MLEGFFLSMVDLVESQIIASIKREEDVEKAINSQANISFLLTGNLLNCKDYISKLKEHGMRVFIHLDLIEGIGPNRSAIQYIAKEWKPDGIISTKSNLIKYANDEGLYTIQRIFLIDRGAINKGIEVINNCKPDAVEVLPGLMPKVIDQLTREIPIPLIVGGLITTKEEVLQALEAGALAVSCGSPKLWNLDL